jgi:hypothetical protein
VRLLVWVRPLAQQQGLRPALLLALLVVVQAAVLEVLLVPGPC